MHWMPVDFLASLSEVGLLRLIPHLGASSLAARTGLMRRLMCFGRVVQLVDDRLDDEDEATLLGVYVQAGWRTRSLSFQLAHVWRDANELGIWEHLRSQVLSPSRFACIHVPPMCGRTVFATLSARVGGAIRRRRAS